MATRLGKVVIYHEEFSLIELLDPTITVLRGLMYIKNFISSLGLDQWPPNMAR